jgi:aquaporin Z
VKHTLTEFIGTFFLVLVVGLTVTNGTPFAPLAIGTILMVMVYMGGHVSGGHYNPAVTLGLVMRRKCEAHWLIPYWIAQLLGGILAAACSYALTGHSFQPAPAPGATMFQALLVEVLFTFALVLVVLNTATHLGVKGNSFYGLAIGFTVMAGAFAGGPISGGAFNPAVGVAPAIVATLMKSGTLSHVWLYIVGQFIGGALAAMVFAIQET